jgi:hypothetical protein
VNYCNYFSGDDKIWRLLLVIIIGMMGGIEVMRDIGFRLMEFGMRFLR